MQLIEIKPKVYFAKFDNKYQMCMTVMRMEDQEEYRFKDRVFAHDELMDWYAEKHGYGEFTYFDDYAGFCVHSGMLRRFIKTFKNYHMTTREKDFVDSVRSVVPSSIFNNKYFSIICTHQGDSSIVFNHELAHAIAYTNRRYYKLVKEIFNEIPDGTKEKLFQSLRDMGYTDKEGYIDEINARIVSDTCIARSFGKGVRIGKPIINGLTELFKEYKHGGKSE